MAQLALGRGPPRPDARRPCSAAPASRQSVLACGTEGMPLDTSPPRARPRRRATRRAPPRVLGPAHRLRPPQPAHAAGRLDDVLAGRAPAQVAAKRAVAQALRAWRPASWQGAVDGCGVPTFAFPLSEVARAYAFLAEPAAVPTDPRARRRPAARAGPRRDARPPRARRRHARPARHLADEGRRQAGSCEGRHGGAPAVGDPGRPRGKARLRPSGSPSRSRTATATSGHVGGIGRGAGPGRGPRRPGRSGCSAATTGPPRLDPHGRPSPRRIAAVRPAPRCGGALPDVIRESTPTPRPSAWRRAASLGRGQARLPTPRQAVSPGFGGRGGDAALPGHPGGVRAADRPAPAARHERARRLGRPEPPRPSSADSAGPARRGRRRTRRTGAPGPTGGAGARAGRPARGRRPDGRRHHRGRSLDVGRGHQAATARQRDRRGGRGAGARPAKASLGSTTLRRCRDWRRPDLERRDVVRPDVGHVLDRQPAGIRRSAKARPRVPAPSARGRVDHRGPGTPRVRAVTPSAPERAGRRRRRAAEPRARARHRIAAAAAATTAGRDAASRPAGAGTSGTRVASDGDGHVPPRGRDRRAWIVAGSPRDGRRSGIASHSRSAWRAACARYAAACSEVAVGRDPGPCDQLILGDILLLSRARAALAAAARSRSRAAAVPAAAACRRHVPRPWPVSAARASASSSRSWSWPTPWRSSVRRPIGSAAHRGFGRARPLTGDRRRGAKHHHDPPPRSRRSLQRRAGIPARRSG